MTWALCLNCGEVKFGAICPCPQCDVATTGDINLDITFSDHRMSKVSLERLGEVVSAIHGKSDDATLCFWAFIHYVAVNHPSILGVELHPEIRSRAEALLADLELPAFGIERTSHGSDSEDDAGG